MGEMTTLGFTGLLISTLHAGSEDSWLGQFSEKYLGDASELFELFESADHALFPTTVAFVAACTMIITVVNRQFEIFRSSTQKDLLQTKLLEDAAREACNSEENSNACRLARRRRNALRGVLLESMHQPGIDGARVSAGDALLELVKPPEARRAEFLRFRARFIEQSADFGRPLPDDFHFGKYLQLCAAENLKGLVSLEPLQLILVWLPLIMVESVWLSASGGVDGNFLPQLFGLAQIPIGVWSVWNFMRTHNIKTLLTPQLGVLSQPSKPAGQSTPSPSPSPPPSSSSSSSSNEEQERTFKLLPPRYALLGGTLRSKRSWVETMSVI